MAEKETDSHQMRRLSLCGSDLVGDLVELGSLGALPLQQCYSIVRNRTDSVTAVKKVNVRNESVSQICTARSRAEKLTRLGHEYPICFRVEFLILQKPFMTSLVLDGTRNMLRATSVT